MLETPPSIIGEQPELPKGVVATTDEKPKKKDWAPLIKGVKKGGKVVGGLTGLGTLGYLAYWLGWGKGGKGIWGGTGLFRRDNEVGVPEGTDPNNPQTIVGNLQEVYVNEGMESPKLQIPLINSSEHINNLSVQMLTAQAGGPEWMLPVEVVDGKPALPENSDVLAEQLAGQLTGVTQQEITDKWVNWHNSPAAFLNFLQTHGANPAAIKFYQCSIDVYNQDSDKATWEDRLPGVQACSVQANQTPEGKPPGNPSMVPVETQLQNQTMAITSRIFKEGVRAEAEVIQAFVGPAMEIAQGLVVNHRLPDRDDVQGWFNTAIEAGDHLVGHIWELPREVRQIVDQQIHHWFEARNNHVDNIPSDYIFQSPAEAINHLTGGGGLPMAIILGMELGLAAINAGLYIKRSAEMRNIKLPSREEIKQGVIKEELKYEKKLKRGIPDSYIRAGLLISPGLFGIGGKVIDETTGRLSEDVLAEVIMNAEDIKLETETYKQLIKLLKSGISEETIREIASRKLLIKGEQLVTPIIKAEDLLGVNFEVISKGQNKGRVCRGEPDWYN